MWGAHKHNVLWVHRAISGRVHSGNGLVQHTPWQPLAQIGFSTKPTTSHKPLGKTGPELCSQFDLLNDQSTAPGTASIARPLCAPISMRCCSRSSCPMLWQPGETPSETPMVQTCLACFRSWPNARRSNQEVPHPPSSRRNHMKHHLTRPMPLFSELSRTVLYFWETLVFPQPPCTSSKRTAGTTRLGYMIWWI